jgi:hypothetical protein
MIRWLVVLLLIANVLFGALLQFGDSGAAARNPDAQLLALQMNAQQVRVVGGGQDRPPPAAGKAAPGPSACLAWGPFNEADAARAREALAALVPMDSISAREVTGAGSWWVHMPPQKSRAEAQKKVGELKALGVTGYSVIESDPEWLNAIDLGAFPDAASARDHLARLQQAGVRSAVVGERRGRTGIEWLVREPGEAVMNKVLEIKQAGFADSALGAVECPPASGR